MMDEINPVDEKAIDSLNVLTNGKTKNYSKAFLLRRIMGRARRLGINDAPGYIEYLNNNKDEIGRFITEMSIHVTHFFRDKAMYDAFMLETLFKLMKHKDDSSSRTLKIWSAGCSSGEETYSIAILIMELLGNRINDFVVEIIGTDMEKTAIEMANNAVYIEDQFRETDPDIFKKYFTKLDDGKYKVVDELKKIVRFEIGDILSTFKPKNVDVIFCRNVVIYFSREIKEKLYQDFYNCINPGGFLVLGKTETLTGPAREKFEMENIAERIYIKK